MYSEGNTCRGRDFKGKIFKANASQGKVLEDN
jgi:hypothetical protein